MSKNSWQLSQVLSTKLLFPSTAHCYHTKCSSTLKYDTFWKSLWLTHSVYLVSVETIPGNCRQSCHFQMLQAVSQKPNSCLTREEKRKKKPVQIFSATLKRSDEHEKQSSKAIFIPSRAAWSAEIKVAYGCHRDASHSGRLTTTRGICAFLNHVCPARIHAQLTGPTHPHRSGHDNLKLPLFKDL